MDLCRLHLPAPPAHTRAQYYRVQGTRRSTPGHQNKANFTTSTLYIWAQKCSDSRWSEGLLNSSVISRYLKRIEPRLCALRDEDRSRRRATRGSGAPTQITATTLIQITATTPIQLTASRAGPHTTHCEQGGAPYNSLPAGRGPIQLTAGAERERG